MSVWKVEQLAPALCAAGFVLAAGSAARAQEASPPIDVVSYAITMELGPDASAFRARNRITFRVTRDGTERVSFDLVGLTVDSVKMGAASLGFERGDGSLRVELGEAATSGDTLAVQIFYHGAPLEGLRFRRNSYGRPTVFADNWPNGARYWFPCVDHPSDKARVEFWVRTPRDWRVVANGRQVNELVTGDGRRLTVWATGRAIPVYTMVVGAGEFAVREIGSVGCAPGAERCVRITEWVFPEDEERGLQLFRRAPAMVAFFDSLIGPFPYEKLALVQSTTRFGGMENASAIFFAERLASGRVGEAVVAHEIAHQWFGDAVTERDWRHLWLSEGFATYFASVFFETADGDTAAARLRAEAEGRYVGSMHDVIRPILDGEPADLFELLNRNNYQKGAWVLHMLRRVVGDEAFFEGIRRYYARFRDGTVLSDDFRRVMEEAAGQDLSWFFEQWLRQPGYPMVEVRPSWNDDKHVLDLRVVQVQSWPPFRFPLEVEVEREGARQERVFWVDGREASYSWELPAEPDGIHADPDNDLLGPAVVIPDALSP